MHPIPCRPNLPRRSPRGLRQSTAQGKRVASQRWAQTWPAFISGSLLLLRCRSARLLRHRRDPELTATCLRTRTVSDNHLAALARTSPQPAPDLIRSSSAARFSSIIADERDSETLPRQRNQRRRPAVQHNTRFRQLPRGNGADAGRLHQRLGFPPPPPMNETLRRRRDSAPAATCAGSTRQPLRATASHCQPRLLPPSTAARISTTIADFRDF